MNNTTVIGMILVGVGLVLLYIGLYGWTGAPVLKLTTVATGASGGGGGGFG